ncbi:hypothetical protein PYW07_008289 [Mythimna separata]|uniref:CRAL-TRIO domain-containing protein n=1 Tax=Mythimna separata TaxID=271217 RepID=A0AAD8DNU2_MYTSE|nr:hypothetical protein PYW07_008289 [Mythimna separata]
MESIPENHLLKLPSGAMEKIRKIHNFEKIERLQQAITILEDWIKKQDHIIKKDFSKDYLERTLITCKGSVEKAKKQIDRSCTMRTLMPKYFSKTNAKLELSKIIEISWAIPLPILTEDYYRVLIVKFNNDDNGLTTETIMQYYQYHIILSEYIKAHDYVNGFIVLYDMGRLNILDLMSKWNPVHLQQFTSIIIEGFGARLKSFHILTNSKAVELLINTVKHLVSEKISNRIYVQPTLKDLHKVVPKEILPVDYGGNERSSEKLHAEWVEELSSEEHVEYMKMMQKACTDETRRHAGKFNEEYMGMPGSFRSLCVD